MPRPALTRSRIVAAGVVIVSEVGLPALSLRAVARRVNATATGVQRHIGETELVESVVGEIVRSMPPIPDRGGWAKRLRRWALETRTWLFAYPGLARYLLADRLDAVAGPDRLESVVKVLGVTELTEAQRVMAATALYRFVLSSTDLDEPMQVLGGKLPTGRMVGSPERWPTPPRGRDCSAVAGDLQFAFGLDLVIGGIDSRAADDLVRSMPVDRETRRP
jgi:AcrR family transcriptional regulator